MDKFPLTKNGFNELEAELKRLKSEDRPNVIAAIAEAQNKVSLKDASKSLKPSSAVPKSLIRVKTKAASSALAQPLL